MVLELYAKSLELRYLSCKLVPNEFFCYETLRKALIVPQFSHQYNLRITMCFPYILGVCIIIIKQDFPVFFKVLLRIPLK